MTPPSTRSTGRGPSIDTLRRMLLWTMNLVAFLSLYLSGEVGVLAGGGFALALGAAWFWRAPRVDFARWQTPWTVATLLAFAATVLAMLRSEGFALTSAMYFLIFLAGAKLFQLAEDKDYTQSMALSLVLLASGSVLNDKLSFGVMFASFVVSTTLGLVVHHLSVEVSAQHGDPRRTRVDRAIFLSTASLAVLVLVGSVAFFFMFPRIGFGFFVQQNRGGLTASGFNDEVELGNHGNIREDARIVMRVRFPGEPPPAPLYFRGLSLDRYTGRAWLDRDDRDSHRLVDHDSEGRGFRVGPEAVRMTWQEATAGATVADIYLEPIDSDVLFSLGAFRAIGLPDDVTDLPESWFGRSLKADATGEVSLGQRSSQGVMYRMWSVENAPTREQLLEARYPRETTSLREALLAANEAIVGPTLDADGNPGEPALDPDLLNRVASRGTGADGELVDLARYYLQLPEGQITERMDRWVQELRQAAPTDVDLAIAIQDRLRQLEYTTDLPRPSGPDANLVDEFLFEWRRGHCEYFATAMVVLARHAGIPARIVNGFVGADYNAVGGYFAVRQANAHSWVEVHFPEHGWVRFDPTPAGAVDMGGDGLLRRLQEFVDNMRLSWFRWVVEYDLEKQVNLVRNAVDALTEDRGERDGPRWDLSDTVRKAMRWVWRHTAAIVLLTLWWLIAGALYQRRSNLRQAWGTPDRVIAGVWAACATLTVYRLWGDGFGLVSAAVAYLPIALTVFVARELRKDLLDGDDARRGRSRGDDLVSTLYSRLVRSAERELGEMPLSMTAREFLTQLDLQDPEAREHAARFLAAYERVRFAGEPLSPELEEELRKGFGRLRRAVVRDLRAQLRDES